MGSRIECFWLEPIEQVRVSLRRYRSSPGDDGKCHGPMGYHDASVLVGDEPEPFDPRGLLGAVCDDLPHDDPRWPKACDGCGMLFAETDEWQRPRARLFVDQRNGALYTTKSMPPGAMYDAKWWPNPGPDGVTLTVICPPGGEAGTWHPDTGSRGGAPWVRTGKIPKVTCSPSILFGTSGYHGHLVEGFLVEC